jgi:UDP-N-acetyl-D-galactosamine dehydrogenase
MLRCGIRVCDSRVLVMGLTFKENCPDIRNTRVIDLIEGLRSYRVRVDVCDPCADPAEAQREYGLTLIEAPEQGVYDAIVLAVAHDRLLGMGPTPCGPWARR